MQAKTTAHNAASAAHDRPGFRRLALAITAVGATMVYFGAKYLRAFWSSGSKPEQANWMRDLPDDEHRIAASIMQVVQQPQETEPSVAAATKADALVAAIQLVTGLVEKSTTASTPVSQVASRGADRYGVTHNPDGIVPADRTPVISKLPTPPAERLNPIAAPAADEQLTLWHTLTDGGDEASRADSRVRTKKYIRDIGEVTSSNLGSHVENLLKQEDISPVIRERMQYIIARHKNESRPVYIMLKLFEETIKSLQELTRISQPDETARHDYHFLYRSLRLFWIFSKVFSDELSASKLASYRAALQKDRWREREHNKPPETGQDNLDAMIVGDYLASKSAEWREQGLTGRDKIVVHNHNDTSTFTIAEIIDGKCVDFFKNVKSGLYLHFQYDNTGLKDHDLIKFVRSTENPQLFINFKQAPRYQPDGYYRLAARELLDLHLRQMSATPLHFDRGVTIERLMVRAAENFFPNQPIGRATKETMAELERLTTNTQTRNWQERTVLAYACGFVLAGNQALYGDLEKQALLDSDYVYRYRDRSGNTRSDVTTLDMFLSRGAKEVRSEIAKRDNVRMLWPKEFSPELIAYLTSGETMVNQFAKTLFTEMTAIKIEDELRQALPPLSERLQTLVTEIGKVYGIEDSSLADEIEFTYQSMLPGSDSADTAKKKFTLGQLVLGTERVWKQKELSLYEGAISGIPTKVADDKAEDYKSYVRSLLAFNAQERLIAQLNELKQDAHLKEQFMHYVDIAAGDLKVSGKPWYEFAETPLLLIFPVRDPTAQERAVGRRRSNPFGKPVINAWLKEASIPIDIVSLISRNIERFDSYADMLQQLAANTPRAANIKVHFPVGYADGFSDLALTEIKNSNDQYERRIDWYIENVDRIIQSSGEVTLFNLFESVGNVGFIVGEMVALTHPKQGFLVSAASVSAAKLAQATLVSTRPDEQKRLIKEAIVSLIQVLVAKVIEQLGGKQAEKIAGQHDDDLDDFTKYSTEWVLERYFFNATAVWRR